MHALPVAAQVAIHLVTLEAADSTSGLAKARGINDNEVVVLGDRPGECEAQRTAIEKRDTGGLGMVFGEVAHDMYADALVGQQVVADAQDEGGSHGCVWFVHCQIEALRYQNMCLGIPMEIKQIDGFSARCAAKGVERDVSLFMLQHEPLDVGDFVIVHVGYAIQKVTAEEAATAWEVYDEMLALESGGA